MAEQRETYQFAPVFTQANAAFNQRTVQREFDYLVPLLRKGMNVIDLGCGAGSITLSVAELVAPGTVLGIDQSAQAVEQATAAATERGLSNVRFEVGDILGLDAGEAAFDCAIISGVLAYLSDPAAALEAAVRSLRPGGILALREQQGAANWFGGPDSEWMELFKDVFQQDWRVRGGDPGIGKDVKSLLREAGCIRVEAEASLAEVLSSPKVVGNLCLGMANNPDFLDRVTQRGVITKPRFDEMRQGIQRWMDSEDSIVSMSEVKAIGWKPES